jgi:shikimate dehydrogenase
VSRASGEAPHRAGGEGTRHAKLAVLGDPLKYTRSPDLHRAGCAALGIACESSAIRTPVAELPATLDRLAGEGYRGCNLTMPLKEPALAWVKRASDVARRARSVNTICFGEGSGEGANVEAFGESTDGAGFVDLLRAHGRDPGSSRITLLGAGAAARSLSLAVTDAGGRPVRVVSRREPEPGEAWGGKLAERWNAWRSPAAERAIGDSDVVVNCTPLGGELPVGIHLLPRSGMVVDLVYGEQPTPWVAAARASGLDAVDGLALLVHQARHSFRCWFGRDVPLEALVAAVPGGS